MFLEFAKDSSYFYVGLDALASLAKNIMNPIDLTFRSTPPKMDNDVRYMLFLRIRSYNFLCKAYFILIIFILSAK